MTATETAQHSDLVGGSTAERRLRCPASYQMEKKLPPSTKEESSSYADEGTALHAAMQFILENNVIDLEGEILGREFEGYVITREMMNEAIISCVDFFDALDDELQAEGGLDFLVEQRCAMPGIPNAFGTSDLIGRTEKRSTIVDWKFGVGVRVNAAYLDEKTGVLTPNAQLMFYARAAMHTFPHMFETDPDWPVDLHIAQPRARDAGEDLGFSKHTVTVRQLNEFRDQLVRAVSEATGDKPRMERGHHCRFAKCKAICPKFTGPAIDLVKLNGALDKKKQGVLGGVDIDWSVTYGELLRLADLAEALAGEVRAQAHGFLEEGHSITDAEGNQLYKLVPKRPAEKYVDELGAQAMVVEHGIPVAKTITEPEVLSPAKLRAVLADKMPGANKKAREEAAKAEISKFTKNVSSGTTLARADDARPEAISTTEIVARLSTKLAALIGR